MIECQCELCFLRSHNTKLKNCIDDCADGNQELREENEKLRERIENLRIALGTYTESGFKWFYGTVAKDALAMDDERKKAHGY